MHLNWVSHENRVPSFTVTCRFFAGALFPCPKWETFGGGSEWEELRIQSSFLVSTAYPGDCQRQAKSQPQRQRFWCIPTYFCICFTDASRKTDLYLLRMDLMVVTCCDQFVHVDLVSNLSYNCIMLIICLPHSEDDYWLSYRRSICSVTTKKMWKLGACARVQIFCWHETQAFHEVGELQLMYLDMYQSLLITQICSWYHILWIFLRKKNDFFFRIFCCFFPENLQKFVWVGGDSDGGKVFGISRGWSCHRPVGRRRAIKGFTWTCDKN